MTAMSLVNHIPTVPDLASKQLYFVGIGGCGMSGLARLARTYGASCSGSDYQASETTESLVAEGFAVSLVQTADDLPDPCDYLVISAAITPEHPQYREAQRRNIPVLKYAQLLGSLMIGRKGVAIAGTHGKSTTTSMLSYLLIKAGLDPSFIVGATCQSIGGGSRVGQSDLLIAEACEYDRSFHHFHPTLGTILNVEEDHLDIYDNLEAVVESFAIFARQLPDDGYLLINHDMPHRLAITAGLNCEIQTVGFAPQADWQVQVEQATDEPACAWVSLRHDGQHVARWINPMPGEHMASNAAVAAILTHRLGADWDTIETLLPTFGGLDRRMQMLGTRYLAPGSAPGSSPGSSPKSVPGSSGGNGPNNADHTSDRTLGESDPLASEGQRVQNCDPGKTGKNTKIQSGTSGGVLVVDDYGHHPTEVDTTLRALRRYYQPTRLICIFQPHQHSRTRFLMDQFATSFSEADLIIVPEIYFVRDSENERHTVSAADLVDRLRHQVKQAMHLYPFIAIIEQLELIARDGDLIVTMGAGDVWQIAHQFLNPSAPMENL